MGWLSAATGILGTYVDKRNADKNRSMQKDFAKHGIRWKVDDAKEAGIHPLAALGSNTIPFTPVYTDSFANSMSKVGQNVERAMSAGKTKEEREVASLELSVRKQELINKLSTLKNLSGAEVPPAKPSNTGYEGQTDVPNLNVKQQEVAPIVSTVEKGLRGKSTGEGTDIQYNRGSDGDLFIVPSKETKDSIEEVPIPNIMWNLRNGIAPMLNREALPYPSKHKLPKGAIKWVRKPTGWTPLYRGTKAVFDAISKRGVRPSGNVKYKGKIYFFPKAR